MLYRDGPTEIMIEANKGDTLSIFVENMGRVGYGSGILRGTKVCHFHFDGHKSDA